MGVLPEICCIFSEQLFIRTPVEGCLRLLLKLAEKDIQDIVGIVHYTSKINIMKNRERKS